jgi:hypothetical protein
MHLEVEDAFVRLQTFGQCLGEIIVWQIFRVIRRSSAISLVRDG